MKISYRNNPIIEKIKNKNLGIIRIHESDNSDKFRELSAYLKQYWEYYSEYFNNIKIITNPFSIAIDKSRNKLCSPELYQNEVGLYNGTFIFHGGKQVICYYLRLGEGEYDFEFTYFVFYDNDILITFRYLNQDEQFGWASKIFGLKQNDKAKLQEHFDVFLGNLFLTIKFIKYAEIEVKFVGANERLKEVNCKYVNDTNSDIQILDSTWFTTLVKTEGFNVRGHFRLQPCGQGLIDRKLIWISEFEKHGYTRNFKKPIDINEHLTFLRK